MSSSTHPQTCRCSLHAQIEARRHDCYRQLAQAILGPQAPSETTALTRALAEHAQTLAPAKSIAPTPFRRAA